jgi:transposase InsO family protein
MRCEAHGSEGGPGKRSGRKATTAPRPDPYSEHPTREGKVDCAVVLDAFSRRVVGWSISHNPTAGLTTNALGMAIEQRDASRGAVIHSDRGTRADSTDGRNSS